ncbi:GCG_CRPN prefix-to-repeats domain-containing protein [Cupriavidus pauculus]|uniref:GCG_CRPN prefix-to-repeats domain-containing protein n=1 Tax=Cupriavidus pauculus TaxID=82633 RepID=UPI001EE34718|nr:hypothetical protein [Cupriavidus pauculus]GJG98474.1 hypothetical protein CBA19C6_28315 [Cupriavidus pauculus]
MRTLATVLAVAGVLLVSASTSYAAEGCGPGGWRGPWGHCHFAGPAVVYRPVEPVMTLPVVTVRPNGCPVGYWRGPWGHCRDTPYHGRLPGGGWK